MVKGKKIDVRCISLGASIKKARLKQGLTQETLAENADIHISYIGQVERGIRYPSLKVIFKIADALRISVSHLFQDTDGKKKN